MSVRVIRFTQRHTSTYGRYNIIVKNGQGLVISTSKKKKLNTKKLTEAGLIGADDVMPQILWTRYFFGSARTLRNSRDRKSVVYS